MRTTEIAAALDALARRSILVVGDVMLDEYQWGSSERFTPGGSAPVVDVERCGAALGGAGNAAANAVGLGARAYLVGVTGTDEAAAKVRDLAEATGVQSRLVQVADRLTSRKVNVYADSRQLLRLDHEVREPVDARTAERVLGLGLELLEAVDVLLVADYAKGTVTAAIAQALVAEARARQLTVVVDTKSPRPDCYRGCTAVTPNAAELQLWSGRRLDSRHERSIAAAELARRLDCSLTLLTEGEEGMTLSTAESSWRLPARASEAVDSCGAGDTAATTFALGLATGLDPIAAAELANDAAGIAVQALGTFPVSRAALLEPARGIARPG